MVKNKNATRNKKNNNNKYFQYAITVGLNHKNVVKHPQKI